MMSAASLCHSATNLTTMQKCTTINNVICHGLIFPLQPPSLSHTHTHTTHTHTHTLTCIQEISITSLHDSKVPHHANTPVAISLHLPSGQYSTTHQLSHTHSLHKLTAYQLQTLSNLTFLIKRSHCPIQLPMTRPQVSCIITVDLYRGQKTHYES